MHGTGNFNLANTVQQTAGLTYIQAYVLYVMKISEVLLLFFVDEHNLSLYSIRMMSIFFFQLALLTWKDCLFKAMHVQVGMYVNESWCTSKLL